MKSIEEQLARYKSVHLNPKNINTHFIGVPLIVLAVTLMLSTVAFEITMDTVPMSEGGAARRQVWIDDVQVQDYQDSRTLSYSDAYYEKIIVMTYLKGTWPTTQYHWHDDVKIEYRRG